MKFVPEAHENYSDDLDEIKEMERKNDKKTIKYANAVKTLYKLLIEDKAKMSRL